MPEIKISALHKLVPALLVIVVFLALPAHAVNVAAGVPVFASSAFSGALPAQLAVDGNPATRWSSAFSDPQWIYVDFGVTYPVNRVVLNWETASASAYQIQVSNDAQAWTTVYTESSGDGGIDDITFPAANARYVRMLGTQRNTVWGYSLFEFEVYDVADPPVLTSLTVTPASAIVVNGGTQVFAATGFDQYGAEISTNVSWSVSGGGSIDASGTFGATTLGGPFTVTAIDGAVNGNAAVTVTEQSPTPSGNLASGVPVFASSVFSGALPAPLAVDGDPATRWSSAFSDPQWIYVDFGVAYSVNRVVLNWETASASAYQIQVSNDAQAWTTVYTESSGNGGIDDITFPAANARYVRMLGTQRNTVWGYSLFEFEVYGVADPPVLTSLTVTPASAIVVNGGTQVFAATGFDQYGAEISTNVSWSVSGGGSIDASGTFGATTLGGPFTVTAIDGAVNGNVSVTVVDPGANQAPVVDAGIDQIAGLGITLQLIAASASDPDGDPITIQWTQSSGTPVQLAGASTLTPSFTTPLGVVGTDILVFDIAVNDGLVNSNDSVSVTIDSSIPGNLALGAPVFASSVFSGAFPAPLAVDGNPATRWSSAFSDPQWIYVDFGVTYPVNRVVLNWETASASAYQIQVSNDAQAWTTVYTESSGDGGIDDITFPAANARYVRMLGTQRNTVWGYSLFEFEVYSSCTVFPSVAGLSPQTGHLQVATDLTVAASTCLDPGLHAGLAVRLALDGGVAGGGGETLVTVAPFSTVFANLSLTEHNVSAELVDEQGDAVGGLFGSASSTSVGIGDYYVAIGDSITWGASDDVTSDDTSQDGRNSGGGFTPILNDLLTNARGYPHTAENEGIPAIKSAGGLLELPDVLARHPLSNKFLVNYGMNDSNPLLPVPSGLGLNTAHPNYPGTYKANLQNIIDLIEAQGKQVALAKTIIRVAEGINDPFSSDPDSESYNDFIKEYNQVVDELVVANSLTIPPPGFYFLFLDGQRYQTEYADAFHPNGVGYQSKANLWLQILIANP